jgi:hypothetical protein
MLKLIAALIILLLLFIGVALWMRNKWSTSSAIKKAKGTVPGGSTPGQATIVDKWTTAPTSITAGTDTTFVLTVLSGQVAGLLNVTNREYIIAAPAGVKIVSINGVTPNDPAFGLTDSAGTITVIINADPVEQPAPGALVAQQTSADSSTAVSAKFTIE